MDAETVTAPMGLEYHPDLLATSEEDGLLAHIDESEWLTDLSRRVMHFGYKYDYTSRRLDETARIGPLPEWLAQLSSMVREAASTEAKQLLDPDRPAVRTGDHQRVPAWTGDRPPHRQVPCWLLVVTRRWRRAQR